MKKYIFSILVTLGVLGDTTLNATIIYVNVNATGTNNGSNWTNAYTDLQVGIASTFPGDTIWVAQGAYKPTATTTRSISFALPDAVKIFGGFNGTETNISQQNYSSYVTMLSGDIGATGNSSDNSYHVITTPSVSNATLLDGFKIISGNANGPSGYDTGAGLYNTTGSPVIRNCTFQSNVAFSGAALAQTSSGGNISVINCVIINNTANGTSFFGGGAMEVAGGNVNFSRCRISFNSGYEGGAFHLKGGNTKLDRCDISGNMATSSSGAIYGYNYDFYLTITNSLIVGNSAGSTGASAIYCASSPSHSHLMVNCTVADNSAASGSLWGCVFGSTSQISNSVFYGNSEATQLSGTNITILNCLRQGVNLTNPQFIAPGNYSLAPFASGSYNYRVSVFSPLINYGNVSYLIPAYNLDIDNTARTQGPAPDAGCYEHISCTFNLSILSSDSTVICSGPTSTLFASNGTAFLWSNNSTADSINVNSTGTYSLLADSAGCLGSASYSLTVLPSPNPIISFSNPILSTTTFSSYQWFLNGVPINGANASQYTATQNGNYTVLVTNSSGCSDTSAIYIILNLGLGQNNHNGFYLFPNPCVDFINLVSENHLLENCEINVTDLQGRIIFTAHPENDNQFTLNLSEIENGLYFISVFDGHLTTIIKIVKQN